MGIGGAIGTGVPLPHVVVGTLRGQALAGGDGVACAVGDARESHSLTVVDVKHAAERADDSEGRPRKWILSIVPVRRASRCAAVRGPGAKRVYWCLSREITPGVLQPMAVIVAEAGEIIGDRDQLLASGIAREGLEDWRRISWPSAVA